MEKILKLTFSFILLLGTASAFAKAIDGFGNADSFGSDEDLQVNKCAKEVIKKKGVSLMMAKKICALDSCEYAYVMEENLNIDAAKETCEF